LLTEAGVLYNEACDWGGEADIRRNCVGGSAVESCLSLIIFWFCICCGGTLVDGALPGAIEVRICSIDTFGAAFEIERTYATMLTG
jgi:hypothetical protein